MSDELLSRLRGGDAEARTELFNRCQTRLRPYFRNRLPELDDVEDCVSEVVTRALEGIRKGARPEVLDAWIVGIAANVLKERYREAKRRVDGELDTDREREPVEPALELERAGRDDDLPELPTELEFLLGKRELWSTVGAAIGGISAGLRDLMRAHVTLSVERNRPVVGTELAKALDVPSDRVDRQLNRAREATRNAIVALVLARTGRDHCPALAATLRPGQESAGRKLVLDPAQSKIVLAHAANCPTCGPRADQAGDYSRWALGPALLGLADDDEERRRAIVALFSRAADGQPGAPAPTAVVAALPTTVSAATAPAGLTDRVRTAVVSKLSRIPGSDTVVQLAQQNPDLVRRAVSAVTGAVALIVAGTVLLAVIQPEPGHSDAAPQPPTSTTTTTSTQPAGSANPVPTTTTTTTTRPPDPVAVPVIDPGSPTTTTTTTGQSPTTTTTSSSSQQQQPPPAQPPQWGYVRIYDQYQAAAGVEQELTTEGIWGTWRNDPDAAISRRNVTFVHDGKGLYRLRLPGIGSPVGITHVTVNFWGSGINPSTSCAIADSHADGPDQLVTVACFDWLRQPQDVRFDVFFSVPTLGGAPMAAAKYVPGAPAETFDSTGGHPTVSRVSMSPPIGSRYLVSVSGLAFNDSGYLQVTPYGNAKARCWKEDVLTTGVGILLVVACRQNALPIPSVEVGWQLTYVQGSPLTHDATVPGAYAQMTGTAPGLRIDEARSYNSAHGFMTVQRQSAGVYLVGFRGVGQRGDVLQATAIGPEFGHCHGQWLNSTGQPGDTWATVLCVDNIGKPADRAFGVAIIRSPGPLVGSRDPVVPGPHPAGPKWGYVRVNALYILATNGSINLPFGVETQLDRDWQWNTWSRGIPLFDALWVRKATVIHQSLGHYRVRLPGIASTTGIAHVSGFTSHAESCSIVDSQPDGIDELVDVSCFGPAGEATDMWFTVFFGEPNTTGTQPMALFRSDPSGAVSLDSTGGNVHVTRVSQGRYVATVDGPEFTGLGYPQITPFGDAPVRCRNAGITAAGGSMRIEVSCDTIAATPVPADTGWQLTYVQGAGLHNDSVPAAYLATKGNPATPTVDTARSYSSTGELATITRLSKGVYRIDYTTISNPIVYPADSVQITTLGDASRFCGAGWNSVQRPGKLQVIIQCFDTAGRAADANFGFAYVRRP